MLNFNKKLPLSFFVKGHLRGYLAQGGADLVYISYNIGLVLAQYTAKAFKGKLHLSAKSISGNKD